MILVWTRAVSPRFVVSGVVFAAILLRLVMPANHDVAALLTVADLWLSGHQIYVDFIEINPPGSFWLYTPFAVWERFTGLPAHYSLDGVLILLAWASSSYFVKPLNVLWLALVLLVPAFTFGEREHIALIALTPFLARFFAPPLEKDIVHVWSNAAGLIIAGMAKPHLLLIVALPVLFICFRERSFRPAFAPAYLLGGFGLFVYVGLAYWLHPAFFVSAMPLAADLYAGARTPLLGMIAQPSHAVLLTGFFVIWRTWEVNNPRHVLLMWATLGAWLAYLLQGKGWPYHALPALVLVLFLMAQLVPYMHHVRKSMIMTAVAFCATFAVLADNSGGYTRAAAQAIRQVAPNPTMGAVAMSIHVSFPLVREVHGTWVQKHAAMWVFPLLYEKQVRGHYLTERDQKRLQTDLDDLWGSLTDKKPQILVVDKVFLKQLQLVDARFAAVETDYKPFYHNGMVMLMKRSVP